MSKELLYENGIQGMYWCHTAYGGDDYDSMGFCGLDDEKAQTVGVHVEMPTGRVDFHMNCDRLGMVDPAMGQQEFDNAVKAAKLFVAAPDLLAALEECLSELESLGWGEAGYTHRANAAIAKAKGGE
jgi:hypothetical protein